MLYNLNNGGWSGDQANKEKTMETIPMLFNVAWSKGPMATEAVKFNGQCRQIGMFGLEAERAVSFRGDMSMALTVARELVSRGAEKLAAKANGADFSFIAL